MPRYIPSLHTQVSSSLQSGEEEEENGEGKQEKQQQQSQLPVDVREQSELQQFQQSNQLQLHTELSRAAADEIVSKVPAESTDILQDSIDQSNSSVAVAVNCSSDNNNNSHSYIKSQVVTDSTVLMNTVVESDSLKITDSVEDWFSDENIVDMLPELNNNDSEQYRISTPVPVLNIQETVADLVIENSVSAVIEMTDNSIHPPEMFQDDKFCQVVDGRDLTDKREDVNSDIDIDNLHDNTLSNSKFNLFASSVMIPDFDMQVNALMHQISAETLVFHNTSVNSLLDRIAANSAILTRAKIKRLVNMSILVFKNLAASLMTKISSIVKVSPNAGIALTSVMSELSLLAGSLN